MSRKRKRKKPQVPLQSMARPLLEEVFARREREELNDDECVEAISALMEKVGRQPVMDALVKKLENASNADRDALMALIPQLGDEKTIAHLWRIVRRSKMSAGIKSTAMVILKQMGEDVDFSDPEAYFSPRDFNAANLDEIEHVSRYSLRMLIKNLHKSKSIGEIEGLLQMLDKPDMGSEGEDVQLFIVEELGAMEHAGAADMLLAIAHATANPRLRRAARDALSKLSDRGVFPQSSLVKKFSQEQFHAAYCTDPANPWQQQVTMIWEWPGELMQAMVFLLDFGFPWRGSIKDMFLTHYLPKRTLYRELIDARNILQQQAPFARARRFILDALEANEQYGQPLPPEYDEFRHVIERRIVNPSKEALAQAEALDAETEDEWGETEGSVVRGISLADGKPIISLDEDAMRAFEEDPEAFDDYLKTLGTDRRDE